MLVADAIPRRMLHQVACAADCWIVAAAATSPRLLHWVLVDLDRQSHHGVARPSTRSLVCDRRTGQLLQLDPP
jgi:hypothetical protein